MLMRLFNSFSESNGLVANRAKCRLYFGGVSREVQAEIESVGLEEEHCHSGIWKFH